jgi:WD40 repeat protein
VLGAPIHGLARAGERIIAAGQGNSALFDGTGRATPLPSEILMGHAYDVAVDPSGRLAAICYHACHLVALEVDTGRIVMRLQLGGVPSGIRKVAWSPGGHFLATASDDQSIRVVDMTTHVEVMRHDEPYDVNGVAWLDEERLAFITDHHVGVLPRAGGTPSRLDVGGGADVIAHEGSIVATTNKHGVAWIDPVKMKVSRKLPVKSASRVRIAPDGNLAWVTVYEGDARGLWRFSIADKKSGEGQRVISGEALFALAIDPLSGTVISGGKAGRIHHVRASGEVVAPGPGTHGGAIEALTVERGDLVRALDVAGRVLRWSVDRRSAEAPWGALAAPYSPHSALVIGDGSLVVSAMNDTSAYAKEERLWSLATERSEAAIVMKGEIITGSGRELIWVDPKSGKISAKAHGGVASSWIHFILAVDDDAFLVAGYDDPRLARWSARERAMKRETKLDRRYDDGRYARTYAMAFAPVSRRLYVSFWNHTFDVIDPVSLEVVCSYDVDDNYAALAVDDVERWAVMAAGHFIDVIDLEAGRRMARRMAPAEVTSLVMVGAGVALAGLATGQIMRATWLTS